LGISNHKPKLVKFHLIFSTVLCVACNVV
jgi:hypothetical protein